MEATTENNPMMKTVLENQVIETLMTCYDRRFPSIFMNWFDLRHYRNGQGGVHVKMTLTSPCVRSRQPAAGDRAEGQRNRGRHGSQSRSRLGSALDAGEDERGGEIQLNMV